MRAIQISRYEGPDAVELVEVDRPVAGKKQVLIEVHAAGVAFPELLQTRGLYQMKPPLPYVPGAEVAGVVMEAPEGSDFSVGDRVAALTVVGGFAEVVAADAGMTFPLPDSITFEQGASFLFNYLTVEFALLSRGRLAEGESVLVHGAAGGIGTAAIQVAKAFGAGTVIAVVSTEQKGSVALAAGADHFVLVNGFKDAVKLITEDRGVDIVVDPVGGDRFTDSLRSLAADGRLLVIGFTAGEIPTVQVNRLLLNNIDVVGVGWGTYALSRPGFVAAQWERLAPQLASGALAPTIGASFDLAEAARALAELDGRTATGKVVLTVR
ncbi:MAG: NADPH:quinone oxidoreductase family protein [Actinomycetota bacterium]